MQDENAPGGEIRMNVPFPAAISNSNLVKLLKYYRKDEFELVKLQTAEEFQVKEYFTK